MKKLLFIIVLFVFVCPVFVYAEELIPNASSGILIEANTGKIFFEKDKVKIDKDILEQTALGFECKVELGEKIGIKNNEI